jgi:hypothetical protein
MRLPGKRFLALGATALLAVFIGIQFVPVHRTNRAGAGDPDAPREVQWILRRACYDCHSTESRWPIWAYVAPVSWRVVRDVETARRHVNFTDWPRYDRAEQLAIKQTVAYVTGVHRMPLWYYVTMHPDARLSPDDVAKLSAWARDTTVTPAPTR